MILVVSDLPAVYLELLRSFLPSTSFRAFIPNNMDKSVTYDTHERDPLDDGTVLGEKAGTVADRDAMRRLGKEQLFKVSSCNLVGLRVD